MRHAHHNNNNNRKIDAVQAVSCKRLFTKILTKVTTKKISKFYCQSAFLGNSNGTEPEQKWFVHTHQTSCRGGWWRKFGALNSNPYYQIFTQSVSVSFSPRSYLFTSARVRTGVHTAPIKEWHAEDLSSMWRSALGIGAAKLPSVLEIAPKSPFLSVNRSPICMVWCFVEMQKTSGTVM